MEELLRLLDEATGAADIDVVDLVRGALASHRVEIRRLKDVFEYYDRKGTGKVYLSSHHYILSTHPHINTPCQSLFPHTGNQQAGNQCRKFVLP